jgi:hypothetical protein
MSYKEIGKRIDAEVKFQESLIPRLSKNPELREAYDKSHRRVVWLRSKV